MNRAERQAAYREKIKSMIARKIPLQPPVIDVEYYVKYYATAFQCGHRNVFREPSPLPGDFHWCYGCMEYQSVVKVNQQLGWRKI